jgi:hypothetical protein
LFFKVDVFETEVQLLGKLLNFLFFSVFVNLLKISQVSPHGIVEDVLLDLGNDFHIHPGKISS